MFTKDFGILKVVAKGVRKIPSRRGGHIEPLTHVVAIISGSRAGHYLAAVEVVDDFATLRQDAQALAHAQQLAHVISQLFEEEQASESLFDALHHSWNILPSIPASRQAMLEGAVQLHTLHCAGLKPDLKQCLVCSTTQPTESVVLDSQQGGWRCLSCHSSFAGTRVSLSPRLLKGLKFIARYPERALQLKLADEEAYQILDAVRTYVRDVIGRPQPASPSPFSNWAPTWRTT